MSPLPVGTRYRVKTTKTGKKVRLAFKKGTNTILEAKNIKTGETHSPGEFATERKRRKKIRVLRKRK